MRRTALLGTSLCVLYGQTFDVASVKRHADTDVSGTMMQELPGTLNYRRVNLIAVIRRAFDVETSQIKRPEWLDTEFFDFEAKLPQDTKVADLRIMLQNLLAERFHLKVHHDQKEMSAFQLVVAKSGFKMQKSPEGSRLGYGPRRDNTGNHLRGRITMEILANNLSGIMGRPVRDASGIEGLYDIELNYAVDVQTKEPATYPDITVALEEQLGLRLQSEKAMFDVIVVDSADKVPVEN